VQLKVSFHGRQLFAGPIGLVEVDPTGGQRVGERDAVAVAQPAHRRGVERAGGRAGAEQAAAEARALLVGPID